MILANVFIEQSILRFYIEVLHNIYTITSIAECVSALLNCNDGL